MVVPAEGLNVVACTHNKLQLGHRETRTLCPRRVEGDSEM